MTFPLERLLSLYSWYVERFGLERRRRHGPVNDAAALDHVLVLVHPEVVHDYAKLLPRVRYLPNMEMLEEVGRYEVRPTAVGPRHSFKDLIKCLRFRFAVA